MQFIEKKYLNITKHSISCAFILFVLYLLTLSPGVNWGDSAKLASLTDPLTLHPNAGYHALRTLLCTPFNYLPIGDIAYRQNISSAFWGAIAIALFFCLSYLLTHSKLAAWISSISLGISHTFWHLSVITESYTVYAVFLMIILLYLLLYTKTKKQHYVYMLSFFAGLAIGAHLLIIFSLIPIAIFIIIQIYRKVIEKKEIHIIISYFLAGISFLIFVACFNAFTKGWSISETVFQTMDLTHSHFLKTSFSIKLFFKEGIKRGGLFIYQFQIIGIGVGILGMIKILKTESKLFFLLISILTCNLIFSLIYQIPKWPYMMLGIYIIFSLFIGYGVKELNRKYKNKRLYLNLIFFATIMFPLITYKIVSSLDHSNFHIARQVPYRNNINYFLIPWKQNENSAIQFSTDTKRYVKKKNIIISDFTATAVLNYYYSHSNIAKKPQIHDIYFSKIGIFDFLEANHKKSKIFILGGAPVYKIDKIKKKYIIIKTGPYFQILKKRHIQEKSINI